MCWSWIIQNNLSFQYGLCTIAIQHETGINTDWKALNHLTIPKEEQRFASYTNLKPGNTDFW